MLGKLKKKIEERKMAKEAAKKIEEKKVKDKARVYTKKYGLSEKEAVAYVKHLEAEKSRKERRKKLKKAVKAAVKAVSNNKKSKRGGKIFSGIDDLLSSQKSGANDLLSSKSRIDDLLSIRWSGVDDLLNTKQTKKKEKKSAIDELLKPSKSSIFDEFFR